LAEDKRLAQWDWLTKPETPYNWRFATGVVIKGLILFALANVLYAILNPTPALRQISIYNVLVPGSIRFPRSPDYSCNLSPMPLDAMLATHEIAGSRKAPDEYRVLLIGDSSVWGALLKPQDTLGVILNANKLRTASGKQIRIFNLGFPEFSLTKDLVVLSYAIRYQPDLIVWMFNLEAFATDQQLNSVLLQQNLDRVGELTSNYQLPVNPPVPTPTNFADQTIIGQRQDLGKWLRLQLNGITLAETRNDYHCASFFEPLRKEFDTDVNWHGLAPKTLTPDDLNFQMLQAGMQIAGSTPVLLINEPVYVGHGTNSHLRYNFYAPRWAYDQYRALLTDHSYAQGWPLVDLWNILPPDVFTDSAVHVTPEGSRQIAAQVGTAIVKLANGDF
jgi:hypothetical protein